MMTTSTTQNEVSHVPLVTKMLDRLPKPEEKDMEEEEIANAYSKSDVISAVDAQFSSNKISDSTDSEYVDGIQEYEQQEKDLVDDEYDSQLSNKDNESDSNDSFDEQLSEAIAHIQSLAENDRDQLIANAMSVYRDEFGDEISSKTLADAFKLVKLQIFEDYVTFDGESDETDELQTDDEEEEAELANDDEKQDILEDEEEVNASEEDIEDEEEEEMNRAKVEADFAEAFEAISVRASIDQELLVNRICDTFVDFNGIEPQVNELSNIFSRIKLRFAQEAQDELFDSVDSVEEEEEEEQENEYELENESDDENDSNYDPDKDDFNYEDDYSEVTESDDDDEQENNEE